MRSLRLRLAVSVITVAVLLIGALAGLLYTEVSDRIRADFDRRLSEDTRVMADMIEFEHDGLELEFEPLVESFDRHRQVKTLWRLCHSGGSLIARSEGGEWMRCPDGAGVPAITGEGNKRVVTWGFTPRLDDDEPAAAAAAVPSLVLSVSRETDRVDKLLDDVARLFWLLGTSACLLVGGVAAWQVARGFAPVRRLAAKVARFGSPESMTALETTGLPAELTPFVSRLNKLLGRLKEALSREREFSGHVAHELRTPLTVLRTGIELAARKADPSSEHHYRLTELLGTVDEMSKLVDNLLMLARVERGAETTQLQTFAVRPMVAAIWRRFEGRANLRELVFHNRIPDDHECKGDPGKLHIVLQNLITNAISYTERGGTIIVETDGDEVLAVWDSGPQMTTGQLERAFDRLWRADLARTDAAQHAGLGLSLARALCRHMRMDIIAENVESGGLRFVVTYKT